ncbi:peptidase M16 [Thiosulfatimonas sediminis]|uniref:Peptidase M16 n=1 Tax=Thiosulfatimonas sediminis TaxID=2675054 RepID=A0A6F8PY73_9GAMM|nr:pitrilysin family protein [Thiosulfatimonas sediminis]BBP46944.1 peptidase M16 [Thiosulfatimonas sediminis]
MTKKWATILRKPVFGALALSLLSGSAFAQISEYQLDNGMQVVVKQDHRAPVVVHQVWYKVGSNFEHSGVTGISHMLEHMMFKGTKELKPGEFSKKVAQMGAKENAFTSSDYTAYYQVLGKQHLGEVMRLEADRMRNIVLTDEEFQKERDVVTEERRWRVEDKPNSKLYEQFKAAAFVNSPAHHPVIGWMADIRDWTAQDARDWYQRWYAPNNATLVVVGDVNPDEVYQLAQKYYGPTKSEMIQPPKAQKEIVQEGERRISMKGATKLPEILMGFHAPTLVTADDDEQRAEVFALSVLSDILSGDDSARLTKNLVRGAQTLVSASASYDPTDRLQTLFILNATPSANTTPQQAEDALWTEIKKLQQAKISQAELDRVLAQAEAQYIYHQDSIQSQAIILGSLLSVGLPSDTLDNWVDNLRKVTPELIQQVANKYFSVDKQTVATLLPNGEQAKENGGGALPGKGVH